MQAIELWSKANLDTAAYGEKQLKERYIRVRFEDLCQNPEAEAVRMLSALSIPRSPTEAALKSVEKPTSVGRFQEEADLIEAVTKAGRVGLKEFGYL